MRLPSHEQGPLFLRIYFRVHLLLLQLLPLLLLLQQLLLLLLPPLSLPLLLLLMLWRLLLLLLCRGFGTCGWKGVGTPDRRPNLLVGSAAATARATLNGLGATACAPAPRPTTLAEGRSCLGVGPTRKPVLKGPGIRPPCARRRGGAAGWIQSPGTTLPTV